MPEHEVWAFGSRVQGGARPYSHLDLAIITASPLGLAGMAALTEAFSESDLPWKVDLVDWATTAQSFRRAIRRERCVLRRPDGKVPAFVQDGGASSGGEARWMAGQRRDAVWSSSPPAQTMTRLA